MSKRDGNAANTFMLSEFGVDVIRFDLLHKGSIADGGDYDKLTAITSYKKGGGDGLINLTGNIRAQRFDLERAIKHSAEFILSELSCRTKSTAASYIKTPPLAAWKWKTCIQTLH